MLNRAILIPVIALASACAPAQSAAPDPSAANRAVAEQLFAAFNRHDADAIAALYAPDAVMTSPDYCSPRNGPEGAAQIHRDLFSALPSLQDEVLTYVASGDHVAVQFVAHSTTPGRTFDLPIVAILQMRDGLIVRDEAYFDTGGQPCTP